MKNRLTFFLLVIMGFPLGAKLSLAADGKEYTYEIESAVFPDHSKFYFFRIDRGSGEIEVYSYKNATGDDVAWYPLGQMKDAYTYIAKPKK